MKRFDRLVKTIMESTKATSKKVIKEDTNDLKEKLSEMINNPSIAALSEKCDDIINSLTDEEIQQFVDRLNSIGIQTQFDEDEDYGDGWDWYDAKQEVEQILNKYSTWCQEWDKNNQPNVEFYGKWCDEEVGEDEVETMDYGWVTDERILRGKYSFYYKIGDALNQGIIKDKFDALILYGFLQMYWNSIDEPDDDGIAACGIDLD